MTLELDKSISKPIYTPEAARELGWSEADIQRVFGTSALTLISQIVKDYTKKLDPHVRLLGTLGNGLDTKVWAVDGKLIRDQLDIDYTEGGHDKVYDYIPENEVWIDDEEAKDEHAYIIGHEAKERELMSQGISYDTAHDIASQYEMEWRKGVPIPTEYAIQ